jgi:hypothetical protein
MSSKALLLTHLGLGDIILCHGIINYLCRSFDEVTVIVKENHHAVINTLFNEYHNITYYLIPDGNYWTKLRRPYLQTLFPGFNLFLLGAHGGLPVNMSIFPLSFYDDAGVSRSEFWSRKPIKYSTEGDELYGAICDISYAFIHNNSSTGVVFDDSKAITHLGIDTDTCLVVNTHKNIYPEGHKFHEAAQRFLTRRLLTDYCRVIENASYVVVSDSSIFALCHLLDIQSTRNYVIKRERNPHAFKTLYQKETYLGDTPDIRVQFEILEL